MKYLSLLALCSILLALPACKKSGCCRKQAFTVTTGSSTVEVGEYVDKEDLEEQEIVEVMINK